MADLKKYDDHMNGVSYSHVHKNHKAVMNRFSRAIGHLEKVKRMVGNGEDCANILLQLAAVRSALDNTGKVIWKDHMRRCIEEAVAEGDQDVVDSVYKVIDRFV